MRKTILSHRYIQVRCFRAQELIYYSKNRTDKEREKAGERGRKHTILTSYMHSPKSYPILSECITQREKKMRDRES